MTGMDHLCLDKWAVVGLVPNLSTSDSQPHRNLEDGSVYSQPSPTSL